MSELVVLMKDFMQVPSGETPTETYHRLKSLYRRWVRPDQLTKEQIGELVIMEQLLRVLPPDIGTAAPEHSSRRTSSVHQFCTTIFADVCTQLPCAGGKSGHQSNKDIKRPFVQCGGISSLEHAMHRVKRVSILTLWD
uniref:SCAN box domain-containing protein n=1 Tax=Knipowitschia caucasica TaxID=637954 RepID=A0AAV2MPG0_KNICA